MNFSCDNCQRRYTIADEKVRDRAVRIRCKACQHLMSVGPIPEPEPEPAPMAQEEDRTRMVSLESLEALRAQTKAPAAAAPAKAAAPNPWEDEPTRAAGPGEAAALWFVSSHGKQIGPFATPDLLEKVRSGELQARNFMWKNGMTDWKRGSDIPELAVLLEAADAPQGGGFGQDFGADPQQAQSSGFDLSIGAEEREDDAARAADHGDDAHGAYQGDPEPMAPAPAQKARGRSREAPKQDLDAGSLFSDLELSKVVRMSDLSDIRQPSGQHAAAPAASQDDGAEEPDAPREPSSPRNIAPEPRPSRPMHTPHRGTVAMSANKGASGFRKFLATLLLLIALVLGAAFAIHERLVEVPREVQAQVDAYWPLPSRRPPAVATPPVTRVPAAGPAQPQPSPGAPEDGAAADVATGSGDPAAEDDLAAPADAGVGAPAVPRATARDAGAVNEGSIR